MKYIIRLSFNISKRYFFSRSNPTVVNLITGISLLGYSVGAMALVILMSALNGFETSIFSSYKKTDADLLITPNRGIYFEINAKKIKEIEGISGVLVVSKVLTGKAVLKYGDQQTVCNVWGVDNRFVERAMLDSVTTAGTPKFVDERVKNNPNLVSNMAILSEGLVYKLGVGKIDQPISLMVIEKDAGIHDVDGFSLEEFVPSAIVSLPEDQNSQTVIIGLKQAQGMFGYLESGGVSQVEIRLNGSLRNNASAVEKIKSNVLNVMNKETNNGMGFVVRNQQEQHPLMYKMFNTEKWISFAILSFVLLLISFNLVGALTLLVMDKRRDFVLFRNLGMLKGAISWVVFWEGIWVSLWGTAAGLILGIAMVLIQQHTSWISTQGTFSIPYPVELRGGDLLLVLFLNVVLGVLSALFPAWRAGKLSGEVSSIQR